jgi:hypothetical protein
VTFGNLNHLLHDVAAKFKQYCRSDVCAHLSTRTAPLRSPITRRRAALSQLPTREYSVLA